MAVDEDFVSEWTTDMEKEGEEGRLERQSASSDVEAAETEAIPMSPVKEESEPLGSSGDVDTASPATATAGTSDATMISPVLVRDLPCHYLHQGTVRCSPPCRST